MLDFLIYLYAMSDLSRFTDEELEKELEDRKLKRPKLQTNPDFAHLIEIIESCIDVAIKEEWWDDNCRYFIYEAALTALYGPAIFKFVTRLSE